jgi:hypothetical protein
MFGFFGGRSVRKVDVSTKARHHNRSGLRFESLEDRRLFAFAGDANFDGAFDTSDLVQVFQAGKFERNVDATWAEGDWNGDGRFSSGDLVVAFQVGRYEKDDPYPGQYDMLREKYVSLNEGRDALGRFVREGETANENGLYALFETGAIYWTANTGAHEVHGAIWNKYASMERENSFLGFPTTDETVALDGVGRFNHFQGGSIYWTPETGAHEVHGAIRDRWAELGWERSVLAYPITDELTTPDGVGRYSHFQGGSIYWSPSSGAYEVHGAIRDKWASLGWERSFLGYPLTNELTTTDGVGRFNHFQGGSIYWTPETGAHEVHGAIRDRWAQLGWSLGYPITDETATPDGVGSYNHFQFGSIYWHPNTGAHEVHGAIREYWASLGWELSKFGYPLTDELTTCDGTGRFNVFERGSIYWHPSIGAYEVLGSKLIFVDFNGATLDERQRALTSLPGWDRTADSLAGDSFVDEFNRLQNEYGGYSNFSFLDLDGDGQLNRADGDLAVEEILQRVRGHYCSFDVQVARVDNSDHAIRLMNNGINGDMLLYAWAWPGDPGGGGQAPEEANNSSDDVGEVGGSISVARLVVESRGLSGEAARNSYYSFFSNFISHEAGHSFGLAHIDMAKTPASQDVDLMTPLLNGVPLTFRDVNLPVDGNQTQNPYQYLLRVLGHNQHRFELSPVNNASRTGDIATVSRVPNSMETWWIGANGSIQDAYWYEGSSWQRFELAPAGSASTTGGITAVSRIPNSMEVWWIGVDGSVQAAYWYEGSGWQRYQLASAGSAAIDGDITVVSRIPGSMEVWWIGANGSIQDAYWYEGGNWQQFELAPAGSSSINGDITAVSRIPQSMEVWWVGANGSIQDAYWYEGSTWNRFELAPAGSASTTGGITAVSRIPNSLEVWWIGANGSIQDAYWYEGSNWQRFELAPAGSASANGGITVVSRIPQSMEVWWVGANGEVRDAYWYEGANWQIFDLALSGSASASGSIASVSRIAGSMEVFWIGPDGQIRDSYWYENDRWRGV